MPDDVLGLEEFGRGAEGLPVGTVLASILPPQAFLAVALPKDAWMHADGNRLPVQDKGLAKVMRLNRDAFYDDRMVENDVAKVPDLRGVFLRGVDSGRGRREGDTEPNRKIGNYQKDSFANHGHSLGKMTQTIEYNTGPDIYKREGPGAGAGTGSTGGEETRPRNVAIYYYVKVA